MKLPSVVPQLSATGRATWVGWARNVGLGAGLIAVAVDSLDVYSDPRYASAPQWKLRAAVAGKHSVAYTFGAIGSIGGLSACAGLPLAAPLCAAAGGVALGATFERIGQRWLVDPLQSTPSLVPLLPRRIGLGE